MPLFNDLNRRIPNLARVGTTKFRAAALAGLALLGCDTDDPGKSYNFDQTSVGLHAFDDCDELSAYFRAEALSLLDEFGGYGQGVGGDLVLGEPNASEERGAAPQPDGTGGDDAEFSKTNTQEADVDEPDLVKTDGRWIYVVRNGNFLIYDASDLSLLSKTQAVGYDTQIMLHDDHVILLSSSWGEGPEAGADAAIRNSGASTTAVIYDVTDREAPAELRRVSVQGHLIAARAAKGTARLAVQFDGSQNLAQRYDFDDGSGTVGRSPEPVSPPRSTGGADARADDPAPEPKTDEANDWRVQARKIIGESKAADWLPRMYDSAEGERQAVACGAMYRPGERAGLTVTAVVSLDLADPSATIPHTGIVSGAGVVYMSPQNLYLTSGNHFGGGSVRGDVAIGGGVTEGAPGVEIIESPLAVDDRQATQIHRMVIDSASKPPVYQGTARVHGAPLNQFSLSEHAGHLRVATTEQSFADGEFSQASNVTVIENDSMETTGTIEGIAEGERIYATRFMGDRGFVVTFRQVDPLFTLDLANPADPRLVGELKVPGFSTYLHPLGDDHLIGIGRSATNDGLDTGMQLSLFDVSTFSDPTLAHAHHFGDAWSDAQYDHHAFTYWGDRSMLFIPVSAWDDGNQAVGVDVFKVSASDGFVPTAHIDHEGEWSAVERTVVIADRVYSVSGQSMRATALDGMEPVATAVFPDFVDDRGRDRPAGEPERL